MNYVNISHEHWEAIYQLEYAIRQGSLLHLMNALDDLHIIQQSLYGGGDNISYSTLHAIANIRSIAKEIDEVFG